MLLLLIPSPTFLTKKDKRELKDYNQLNEICYLSTDEKIPIILILINFKLNSY